MIVKHAQDRSNFKNVVRYYSKARDGMYAVLKHLYNSLGAETILLPSYIGFSPKEGSGVYDPIEKLGCMMHCFYRVDKVLKIDFEDVKRVIASLNGSRFVFLRMDYYGFTDKIAERLYDYIKTHGGIVLEDNAHSTPTSFDCMMEYSDVAFFSLHKILPFSHGGMIVTDSRLKKAEEIEGDSVPPQDANLWEYDLCAIAKKRQENFSELARLADQYQAYITPIRTSDNFYTNAPYTFPVILHQADRLRVYDRMNEAGFGVTCLYYALIKEISKEIYPENHLLSDTILNFSVHQDVDKMHYPTMLSKLESVIHQLTI